MKDRVREILTMQGALGRVPFLVTGIALFLLKWALDTSVARFLFDRTWSVAYYWAGQQTRLVTRLMREDQLFLVTMVVASLPFIWLGILLTAARLRSAKLPLWLVSLFFVPVLNLVLFAVLAIVPPRGSSAIDSSHVEIDPRQRPRKRMSGRGFAIATTGLFGTLLTIFDVYSLGIYGVGLFVGLPFCLGAIAALLVGRQGVSGCRACVGTAVLCVSLIAAGLFFISFEGLICLLMAAPIWIGCAALGGVIGYVILVSARDEQEAAVIILALALIVPAMMGAEAMLRPEPTTLMVRSSIEIAAPPTQV